MSNKADTFALLSSWWAKELMHSHFWALDEQKSWYIRTFEAPMSKNADTFALYANVHIISSPCSAFGFSYCPAHLNFLIKSFKEITFFLQTLPSPLPAAKTKQNAETFKIFLRWPFKIRKYSRLPRPPRGGRGGADPLKHDTKEIFKTKTI